MAQQAFPLACSLARDCGARLPEEMSLRDAARLLQNQIGGAPVVDYHYVTRRDPNTQPMVPKAAQSAFALATRSCQNRRAVR
jgi:hypothetical protein